MKEELTPFAREIRQTRPFPSTAAEATLALLRTADHVRRILAETVAPFGLTLQQYNVLRILRGAGPGGLPTLEIADRMIERAPGVTRLIDRLEQRRLVSRARGEDDRRQVVCRIEPAGLDLLRRLDPIIDQADQTATGALDDPELQTLLRLLARIRSAPG